ncbi:CBS domain-containing protein [Parasediminibacterium sp. JCM 36343]|uniref:CBS domain-containing protein n=1 Tax=Parasediminibacterium sp. JCM 36343 TaxID=3374279 RepID=UPI0039784309
MLVAALIQTDYPSLQLQDKVSFALQLMDDYEITQLPVVVKENFTGIIAKDDLLDADEDATLASLQHQFIDTSVKKEAFFLTALKAMVENSSSLVAVVNETKEYQGIITSQVLLEQLSKYLGNDEPGAVIVLEVERRNYSFGEISRLVETNDAYITQLNTYTEADTGLVIVSVKINKLEISDIIATFQRYDYVVRYYFGEELYANELKENYNHLMAYLNL